LNIIECVYRLVIPLICGLMKRLMEQLAIPLDNPQKVAKCLFLVFCFSQTAYADDLQDANRLFEEDRYSQAMNKVNDYLANKPKDAQARFLKGMIFTGQGKTKDAIRIFSDLTEDYPELPEPYNNLAVLYAGQGQYEKAKLSLEKALRTHPSYATAHENLSDIYAKMASEAYDRALQLEHSSTATQIKLVMLDSLYSDGSLYQTPFSTINSTPALVKIEEPKPVIEAEHNSDATKSVPSALITSSTVPVVPTAQSDQNKEVLETVDAWAAAWSSQDANKYLSFYAADFKTPDNQNRTDWESYRRERVTTPEFIQVSINNATVKFSDTEHATVSFRQSYLASHLKASGKKTLLLVKTDGNWQIQEERTR